MNDLFSSMIVLWIASAIAAIFVTIVIVDGVRAHRKHSHRAKFLERRAKLARNAAKAVKSVG